MRLDLEPQELLSWVAIFVGVTQLLLAGLVWLPQATTAGNGLFWSLVVFSLTVGIASLAVGLVGVLRRGRRRAPRPDESE